MVNTPTPTFEAIVFDGIETMTRTLLMERDSVGFRLPTRIETRQWDLDRGESVLTGHLVLEPHPMSGMAVYRWVALEAPVAPTPDDRILAGVA